MFIYLSHDEEELDWDPLVGGFCHIGFVILLLVFEGEDFCSFVATAFFPVDSFIYSEHTLPLVT